MTTANPLALAAALRARAQAAAPQPHVILIYDLHGASPSVYTKLDAELRSLQYTKIVEDTTWEGRYQTTVTLDAAVAQTKIEFEASARKVGATSYNLRVYGSPSSMVVATASKP
jgi:hypothetical protein